LLHQVGDLFELNVKFRCQKVNALVNNVPLVCCESDKQCDHNPDEEWVDLLVLLYYMYKLKFL